MNNTQTTTWIETQRKVFYDNPPTPEYGYTTTNIDPTIIEINYICR